jgi:hypothetical protein
LRALDATKFGGIAPGIVVGCVDDHQEPVAALPDLHCDDSSGSNVIDHRGPDRTRLVHVTVLLDQCRVIHQVER